ncbi:MAG: FAD-dependent oxidoreductase, partial [Microbacterium sp.]
MSERLEGLAAQARAVHAVVVGGGVAGLVAALEFARVGMRVTVLEAEDRLGGVLRSAEVAGVVLDVGAESFATRGGHVRALIDRLGLSDAVVAPAADGAWVAG